MAISPCLNQTDLHHRELAAHGSTAFPIACYEDELMTEQVPWHWHDEFEFAIVTKGSPEFFFENAREILEAGDAVFINGGALHAAKNGDGGPAQLHSGVFHARLVGGSVESVFWQRYVHPVLQNNAFRYCVLRQDGGWQEQIRDCCLDVWNAMKEEPEEYENFIRFRLTEAMGILYRNQAAQVQPLSEKEKLEAERIRTMLEYIEMHFTEEIEIEQIAGSIAVSKSVCMRLFQKMLGTSPIQYVKNLRLDKAAGMLKNQSMTAQEAAFACGFRDVSYFTKSFRQRMGMTPKTYQTDAASSSERR